jgi:nucleoside-diphosphate-sugar epimerase
VLRRTSEPEIIAKEHIMKIAVAGVTGRLGRPVAEVLIERGHQVVAMSRATGVDIITGSGLAAALDGAQAIIDAATSPG